MYATESDRPGRKLIFVAVSRIFVKMSKINDLKGAGKEPALVYFSGN